ncbi:hypothetical protein BpHYR1_030722 [Brachionus plicatilis]|uniref:Uncharacterized protein n=1 Tax=Brachionus plicatilis TaxID=10195 RepID=A0A3M7RHN8_BRAPC|nr:hypothetical protein BpHYR1_030722 [Brachionus plicatilis]
MADVRAANKISLSFSIIEGTFLCLFGQKEDDFCDICSIIDQQITMYNIDYNFDFDFEIFDISGFSSSNSNIIIPHFGIVVKMVNGINSWSKVKILSQKSEEKKSKKNLILKNTLQQNQKDATKKFCNVALLKLNIVFHTKTLTLCIKLNQTKLNVKKKPSQQISKKPHCKNFSNFSEIKYISIIAHLHCFFKINAIEHTIYYIKYVSNKPKIMHSFENM